jgi:hypothetical protein
MIFLWTLLDFFIASFLAVGSCSALMLQSSYNITEDLDINVELASPLLEEL